MYMYSVKRDVGKDHVQYVFMVWYLVKHRETLPLG